MTRNCLLTLRNKSPSSIKRICKWKRLPLLISTEYKSRFPPCSFSHSLSSSFCGINRLRALHFVNLSKTRMKQNIDNNILQNLVTDYETQWFLLVDFMCMQCVQKRHIDWYKGRKALIGAFKTMLFAIFDRALKTCLWRLDIVSESGAVPKLPFADTVPLDFNLLLTVKSGIWQTYNGSHLPSRDIASRYLQSRLISLLRNEAKRVFPPPRWATGALTNLLDSKKNNWMNKNWRYWSNPTSVRWNSWILVQFDALDLCRD